MVSDSLADASKWGQVAFTPDGKVHIIWEEDYHDSGGSDIFYASYDGFEWNGPIKITNSRNIPKERPHVSTSQDGGVFAVWNQAGEVYFREYDPISDKWLPDKRIATGDYEAGEPQVAVDPDGNIYIFWFAEAGRTYSRSRINGEWENIFRLSSTRRATQGGIAAGKDGRVWVIWREKQSNGEYKIYYRKRTKNTEWSSAEPMNWAGASQSHPCIAVGPDHVPVVSYEDVDVGEQREIWICTLDEDENPREMVEGVALHHYSRIAIDSEGNKHVAWQIGPGDFGFGIKYTNNMDGKWKSPVVMPNSSGWPKLPGIAADEGGNVALVWASSISGRDKEIWFSSLYPVELKRFDPPAVASCEIAVSAAMRGADISYTITWEKNPNNTEKFISGYNIYVKEGQQDWQIFKFVDKSEVESDETTYRKTYSSGTDFTTGGANVKRQFGITTVSTWGQESDLKIID